MKVETGKARKPWPCNHNGCKKKIAKGQEYFLWHIRGVAQRQHTEHGQPAVAKPATKKPTKAAKKVTKKKVSKKKVAKKGKGGKK